MTECPVALIRCASQRMQKLTHATFTSHHPERANTDIANYCRRPMLTSIESIRPCETELPSWLSGAREASAECTRKHTQAQTFQHVAVDIIYMQIRIF